MKSFLEWFRASTKVKRWIFLIILGVALTCYAFSKILVTEEIEISELIQIIVLFVTGFLMISISVVFIQKRTLEIFIEANDSSTEKGKKAKVNIKSLIFNKKVYEEGPKIVVIGGGQGLNTVIEGLKKYTNNITAIVTMSDYGNVPTESRKALDSLPLKDIKDSIVALSDREKLMKQLLSLNFKNERLKGLNFGDIYLTAMNEIYGNISEAIQKSTEVLNITGRVIPVTLDEITICAELTDGTTVKQKNKIPEVVSERVEVINRIYISPSNCRPAPGVLEAIEEAEAIIIGPGSLYTNVLPNLLVKNVSKAIKESKAIKLYISNIMTEPGQTDNYSISEHIKAIIDHVGNDLFDICLADTGEVMPEFVRRYNMEGSELVEQDFGKVNSFGIKVIQRNMSCIREDKIRHNPDIIAATVIELICNDLKFHDMQNGTEYMLLNSVLKEQNKLIEKNAKVSRTIPYKSKNNDEPKRKSKFKEKYSDRFMSIKNSDKKREENKRRAEGGKIQNAQNVQKRSLRKDVEENRIRDERENARARAAEQERILRREQEEREKIENARRERNEFIRKERERVETLKREKEERLRIEHEKADHERQERIRQKIESRTNRRPAPSRNKERVAKREKVNPRQADLLSQIERMNRFQSKDKK